MLTILYSDDLLVDVFNTDIISLQKEIHSEISRGNFNYPWIYDRKLYDKFFASFTSTPDVLTCEATASLLENTQQGVFQAGKLTIGPCGLLESSVERELFPTLRVNLFHCPDPSCNTIHKVQLRKVPGKISHVKINISNFIKDGYGEPSKWAAFFDAFIDPPTTFYDDYNQAEFPYLLTNAFSESELRVIFAELLDLFPKYIRSMITTKCAVKYTKIFKSSSIDIAAKLTRSECFQLI